MLCLAIVAPAIHAQEGSAKIEFDRDLDKGLEGFARPGTWATMRFTVRNNLPSVRKVHCDWVTSDIDGDLVISRRENVVLNPNGTMPVRMYAMPASNWKPEDPWVVRVFDAESGELLDSKRVTPPRLLTDHRSPARERVENWRLGAIGVTGGGLLGLDRFREIWTQHEPVELITGIDPSLLPDRWHGMMLLDALVWTPQAGRPPTDPSVPMAAIREWVRRGGHLVISVGAVDSGWSDPKLADLLPPVVVGESREIDPPLWMRDPKKFYTNLKIAVRPLKPAAGATARDVSWLLVEQPAAPATPSDPAKVADAPVAPVATAEPPPALIASRQYGFGRVTLIGLDVTDRKFLDPALGYGEFGLPTLWKSIFRWQSPGNLPIATLENEQRIVKVNLRDINDVTSFLPSRISMKKTAASTLLLAFVLFIAYWVLAGPGVFGFLKSRGKVHHAWLGFGVVVVAFSAITWFGAMFLRPSLTQIEHFSIIDIDASPRGPALVRTHSWFSLFLPRHAGIDVAVDAGQSAPAPTNPHSLASPGLPGADRSEFSDRQQYTTHVHSPGVMPGVPMRATAKQFEADYLDVVMPQMEERGWTSPAGAVREEKGWPAGKLTHSLPGTLKNVQVVFCRGNGIAQVWAHPEDWGKGEALDLTKRKNVPMSLVANVPHKKTEAKPWKPPKPGMKATGWEDRAIQGEGDLGERLHQIGGGKVDDEEEAVGKARVDPGTPHVVNALMLFSFHSMLPPPDFLVDQSDHLGFGNSPAHWVRTTGRHLDLSALTVLRRVIIIGHLDEGSPMPTPIRVDGDEVESRGWTMVRFILPVQE